MTSFRHVLFRSSSVFIYKQTKEIIFEVKHFLLEENLASLALAFEALLSLPALARL